MSAENVLECRGLRRRIGEIVAVGGVGFGIAAGETYGLLGPNGAGKTTTISMIAGLLERDGGVATVDGVPKQQAIGVSLLLGLGLGALGGCMVPLEVFSPTMRQVAHITPQAWGNDAFAKLVGHGASIAGILPQLGILAAYAVVLLALAAWRLRRVLSA